MKRKEQGFMLGELIVSSVVVITTIVSLYLLLNSIYNEYIIKNRYFSMDATNASILYQEYLIDNNQINEKLKNIDFDNDLYFDLTNCKDNYCQDLKTVYGINKAYLVSNNIPNIEEISNTFKEYITYLKKITSEDKYLIIIETNDNKYGYLKVD